MIYLIAMQDEYDYEATPLTEYGYFTDMKKAQAFVDRLGPTREEYDDYVSSITTRYQIRKDDFDRLEHACSKAGIDVPSIVSRPLPPDLPSFERWRKLNHTTHVVYPLNENSESR